MTRTALIMNGLAAFRFSSMRQSAKALFKPKEQGRRLQIYYNHQKTLKKVLTSSIIKLQKRKRGTNNETVQILSPCGIQKRKH